MDDDYFLGNKRKKKKFVKLTDYFGKIKKTGKIKKINILIFIILALSARLFFGVFKENDVFAQKTVFLKNFSKEDFFWTIGKVKKTEIGFLNDKKSEEICQKDFSNKIKEDIFQKKYFLSNLVKGYPIEKMIPSISEKNQKVAAFLIGIAKKESDWGIYSPRKNGLNCYNYWGYRGGYNLTDSGYSCFDTPEQAVKIVGDRIEELIEKRIDSPQEMVVWKCGSSCAGHNPKDVKKWISDVGIYFYQLI